MLNGPFPPWPNFDEAEVNAVADVMRSNRVNYWTGDKGKAFEHAFAEFADCQYAVAVANGSLALDLALHALDLPKGSEVIVTSRTFIASISSIVLAGLVPVFADVHPDSQNIHVDSIQAVVTEKTSAILCVHLAGWPCDMPAIMALAKTINAKVIEDCAQAHGAKIHGRSVGSYGHIAAWSFCQDKIMTTMGEGGMVTTNDRALWQSAWSFKDHGKDFDTVFNQQHPPGFRWLHAGFGTNFRLTEAQSAVGLLQLEKMSEWTQGRQALCQRLWQHAAQLPGLRVPTLPEEMTHAGYKCYIFVEPEALIADWDRDRIIGALNTLGVPCFSGSCSEVYLEKAFDNQVFKPTHPLPVARQLGDTSLMFLVHPGITHAHMQQVCDALQTVMQDATHDA